MNNSLKVLDFTTGIRAKDIDYNFNLIEDWIERERIRIGGYGIVEGFDLSGDTNLFTVSVSDGILINEEGKELLIDAYKFQVGEPSYVEIEEDVIVGAEGLIELKYKPYSPINHGTYYYNPPESKVYPDSTELSIMDLSDLSNVPILSVIDNKITVNANNFTGAKVRVKYRYCDDRIDAILLHKDGTYLYQRGLLSTSPSCIEVLDYKNYYLIGFAHWIVDRTISIEFIINDRTYRKVYVNKDNVLYLNGKPYKEVQEIYFKEPENPSENMIWYDKDSNQLYIWQETNGVFGWIVINDTTNIQIRESKIWYPENMPDDLQTFLFEDDEVNLRYSPNINSLEIIIDNVPLMQDQFTEVLETNEKEYLTNGIGFKLVEPLDRNATVQVVVNHNVRNGSLKHTFQRAAIFTDENYYIYSPSNIDNIFETNIEYAIGNHQIEIYVNGIRITDGLNYVEMVDTNVAATSNDKDRMTKYFKILDALSDGDKVEYKTFRHVWNYNQLDYMVEEIENKADTAIENSKELKEELSDLSANIEFKIRFLESRIDSLEKIANEENLSRFMLKTDKIDIEQIPSSVLNSLVEDTIFSMFYATEDITLDNLTNHEYLLQCVLCGEDGTRRILLERIDYNVAQEDDNIRIVLKDDYILPEAYIYITGFKLGPNRKD